MLSKEDQEEHVKKGLCFKCHKHGHRSFECPTINRKIAALEMEQDDDDGSDSYQSIYLCRLDDLYILQCVHMNFLMHDLCHGNWKWYVFMWMMIFRVIWRLRVLMNDENLKDDRFWMQCGCFDWCIFTGMSKNGWRMIGIGWNVALALGGDSMPSRVKGMPYQSFWGLKE